MSLTQHDFNVSATFCGLERHSVKWPTHLVPLVQSAPPLAPALAPKAPVGPPNPTCQDASTRSLSCSTSCSRTRQTRSRGCWPKKLASWSTEGGLVATSIRWTSAPSGPGSTPYSAVSPTSPVSGWLTGSTETSLTTFSTSFRGCLTPTVIQVRVTFMAELRCTYTAKISK